MEDAPGPLVRYNQEIVKLSEGDKNKPNVPFTGPSFDTVGRSEHTPTLSTLYPFKTKAITVPTPNLTELQNLKKLTREIKGGESTGAPPPTAFPLPVWKPLGDLLVASNPLLPLRTQLAEKAPDLLSLVDAGDLSPCFPRANSNGTPSGGHPPTDVADLDRMIAHVGIHLRPAFAPISGLALPFGTRPLLIRVLH